MAHPLPCMLLADYYMSFDFLKITPCKDLVLRTQPGQSSALDQAVECTCQFPALSQNND